MTADIRASITQRIVEALEKGVPPWRKGWTAQGGLHYNASSNKPYRGLNQLLLGLAASELLEAGAAADPRWMTLKQANRMGLAIRKGSKAATIVRMVEVTPSEPTASEDEVLAEDKRSKLVLKCFHVFHASQIEGLAPLSIKENRIEPVAAAESLVEGMKADGLILLHGGDKAAYIERLDTVRMPERVTFHSTEDFYSTMLHELSHATGSAKRLKRLQRDARFGSSAYAREELVAELASAMACTEVGIPLGTIHLENCAAYLSSWIECLKEDKNAIFAASGAAERACQYLRDHAVMPKPEVDVVVDPEFAPSEVARPTRRRGMRL